MPATRASAWGLWRLLLRKHISGVEISLILALVYLLGLCLAYYSAYLNSPEDNLFYDRILVLTIFLYRSRWMCARFADKTSGICAVYLLSPGLLMTVLSALVFRSQALAIYGTLAFAFGLILAWHGRQVWRRALPAFAALAVVTYPPQSVFAWMCEFTRWLSYFLSKQIAGFVMPHLIFGDYLISSTEFDFDIMFAPACGGIFFVLSYLSLMILINNRFFDAYALLGTAFRAVMMGLIINIARIIFILALVSWGEEEAALHSMHELIGHIFATIGIAVLMLVSANPPILHHKET